MNQGARPFDERLDEALGGIRIESMHSLSIVGRGLAAVVPWSGEEASRALVRTLQDILYDGFYARSPKRTSECGADNAPDRNVFVRQLSEANKSETIWETGWTLLEVRSGGGLRVAKGGIRRSVWPGEYAAAFSRGDPARGESVALVVARELTSRQQGFYVACGNTVGDERDEYDTVRFYFNVEASAAPELVAYLTQALNRYGVPFRLKTLDCSEHFDRADSAILYIAKRFTAIGAFVVAGLPWSIAGGMGIEIPLFAKALRRGVAFAEDPHTGESFGEHRCRMTAEAMVEAWSRGSQNLDGQRRLLQDRFAQEGYDLERPHLNPGSVDPLEAHGLAGVFA